jgi:hypothetical protein
MPDNRDKGWKGTKRRPGKNFGEARWPEIQGNNLRNTGTSYKLSADARLP